MELEEAASQISEIHAQMLKSEVFRGYRSLPVATTGILALLAALLQPGLQASTDPTSRAWYWVVVALLCAVVCFADLAVIFWQEESPGQRERIKKAVGQVLPALVAGAVVTWTLIDTPAARFLPGLWLLIFSLCLFGSRLFLPRRVGLVALFYFCVGAMWLLDPSIAASPLSLGLPFACGQLALAAVLYHNLEREQE